MQIMHGSHHFGFIPKTFILPNEFELLEEVWFYDYCGLESIVKDYKQNKGICYIVKHQDPSKDKEALITRNIEKVIHTILSDLIL